jgi:hypothetical protein
VQAAAHLIRDRVQVREAGQHLECALVRGRVRRELRARKQLRAQLLLDMWVVRQVQERERPALRFSIQITQVSTGDMYIAFVPVSCPAAYQSVRNLKRCHTGMVTQTMNSATCGGNR